MTDPVLIGQDLVKSFGDHIAVDHVSLIVPRGSIYGVLGPNGAGKTTTIRMMLGIINPDSGSRQVLGESNPRAASFRIGYLPEERGLYPNMTAREAIAFLGALRGLGWSEGRRRAGALMETVGLSHAADAKIRTMSKGMAQMVQLIGSIVHQPELIILDEPFSGLDPVNQERLEGLIATERARGATIIFSTHVMAHAERLCDRLTVIARARHRFEGTVAQARESLPLEMRFVARSDDEARILAALPGARRQGREWYKNVAEDDVDAVLAALVASGVGIANLSIDRPSLHAAFVAIVRQADADAVDEIASMRGIAA